MKKVFFIALFVGIFLTGCGLSLAEDVTPPPNYRRPTEPSAQPAAARPVFPILAPDPAVGKAIYVDKCQACHGERGMGDGPQAPSLPNPAAPIGSPALAREARPVDWYQVVTEGNLQRFMPGFSSLTDRERWDVVAYVFTLGLSETDLAAGKELYASNCAECHGPTGQGDGPRAADLPLQPASWTDQSLLAQLSASGIVERILSGGDGIHAFQDILNQEQAYTVAGYIRTLSFAGAAAPAERASAEEPAADETAEPEETPEAAEALPEGTPAAAQTGEEAPASSITIRGRVTNATPGGQVPAGLTVDLAAYRGMTPAFEQSAEVAADGSYVFEDVDFDSDYVYFARVEANGLFFNSDILHGRDVTGEEADLPVQIYDTTSDVSVLRTDRLHVFFDFSTPGRVQVVNLYIISNPSGRVVIAPQPGEPVVRFELPENAENLQFQDGAIGDRYVQTENGFGDTAAVPPGHAGMNQILFAYELPYIDGLTYSMKVPLPVQSAVVMVPAAGVTLRSSQLQDAGQRDLEGMSFRMYQAASALAAGDSIELSLRGRPNVGGEAQEDPLMLMLVGLGVFGAVLAGAGFWLLRQRSREQLAAEGEGEVILDEEGEPLYESSESLLEAIIALDDQHASGTLPEEAYQKRRAELKALLADALAREQEEGKG